MDITKWAEDLTEEVYNEWKTKYSFWKPGFAVFSAPVRYRPELLIISLNPGGGEKDFQAEGYPKFKGGNFSVPKQNRYVTTDYPFAKKIRVLFEGNEDVLKTSMVVRILFFRSKDMDYWKDNNPKKTRLAMEKFSYDKIKQILDKVKPKKLLVVGSATYGLLRKNVIKIENENKIENWGTVGHITTAKYDQIDIFVTPHLSSAHISKENKKKMKKLFADFLTLT